MYSPYNSISLNKKLEKLYKKDKMLYEMIYRKMEDIVKNPNSHKQLGNIFHGRRRVHVEHFVLIFSVNEEEKAVVFEDFDHHDKIYKK